MFLKNKNIIFKIRRSKVTDYAAFKSSIFVVPIMASKSLKMLRFLKHQFQSKNVLIQRGGGGSRPLLPLKNHKNMGFLSNTGPDPQKNHKAIKPAFNVGPTSAGQQNAI